MKLNGDKTTATLEISGSYNAEQLDRLLRDLALLRADLTPQVPEHRSGINEETHVLIEDKPALTIAARQNGGFRMWVRHRGYGWLAYQIDDQSAVGIAGYISSRAGPAIDLVSDQSGNAH